MKHQFRSASESEAKEASNFKRAALDLAPKTIIEDLDIRITEQAESLYENLIDQEGYSEEQAQQIALTRVGKEGGLLDEGFDFGENEDELRIHEENE